MTTFLRSLLLGAAAWLAFETLAPEPVRADDYWNGYAELVGALSVDEVNGAARRLLQPDRMTWVVVGDLRVIESQERELGFGTVSIVDADGKPVGSR